MYEFYQGTTVTLLFTITKPTDFDISTFSTIHITIKSVKTGKQKTFAGRIDDLAEKKIAIDLTQEDTLDFNSGELAVQGKFKLTNGKVIASKEIHGTLHEIFERTVL